MKSLFLIVAMVLIGQLFSERSMGAVEIQEEVFGTLPGGGVAKIFTLTNGKGCRVRVSEIGATIVSVETPDRAGKVAQITLGYEDFADWVKNAYFFGSTAGRFGNRIDGGKFELDGKSYQLVVNNHPGGIGSSLHGGAEGFHRKPWTSEKTENGVIFRYVSRHGEEGYPGNLSVEVTYTLTDENELKWAATAKTDAATVLNVIQHAYWNLSGDARSEVLDHELQIEADHYLPTNAGLIPTGERAGVAGTPMDFRKQKAVGAEIGADFPALKMAGGYDHAFVFRKGEGVRRAARLSDPKSGRVMEVFTDAPAVQFYAAKFDGKSVKGAGGVVYAGRAGLCLETQNFPDAPNQPDFPSPVLRPGETYRHTQVFKFTAE